ncbi:MAG: sel1 repeat family protein [Kordiimonadaceae bacterium]|nr:sel1 repeat family protein [Kordiimonadaceae bacterium]
MKYLILILCYLLPTFALAQDYKPLFNKLSEMASEGDGEAQYHLGMLYNNGIGTSKDIDKAYYWFKKSTEANDPLGAYKLGCYFAGQAGDVVEYDAKKALKYKLIAADAGYSYAQHDVALYYLQYGENDKAIEYITKSAHQGFRNAFEVLANLNYEGTIIPKNLLQAHSYILLSMMAGDGRPSQQAVAFMKIIEQELTQAQINKSIENADKWQIEMSPLTLTAKLGLRRSYRLAGLSIPEN